MPMYDFECPACEWKGELQSIAISMRDEQTCRELLHDVSCDMGDDCSCTPKPCGEILIREEIPPTLPGRVDHRHQTKAIMTDGTKVAGHFGVEAKINKGRY